MKTDMNLRLLFSHLLCEVVFPYFLFSFSHPSFSLRICDGSKEKEGQRLLSHLSSSQCGYKIENVDISFIYLWRENIQLTMSLFLFLISLCGKIDWPKIEEEKWGSEQTREECGLSDCFFSSSQSLLRLRSCHGKNENISRKVDERHEFSIFLSFCGRRITEKLVIPFTLHETISYIQQKHCVVISLFSLNISRHENNTRQMSEKLVCRYFLNLLLTSLSSLNFFEELFLLVFVLWTWFSCSPSLLILFLPSATAVSIFWRLAGTISLPFFTPSHLKISKCQVGGRE